jgi:AcrR family transcriptional regulator
MSVTKEIIADRLDKRFAQKGFTALGVDELSVAAQVSIRTLYKYYPSREKMIVGALSHRNDQYFKWLDDGLQHKTGTDRILHIFSRLSEWLDNNESHGCLFLNAMSSYPESNAIKKLTKEHKNKLFHLFLDELKSLSSTIEKPELLAESLLVIHEGQTKSAMTRDTSDSNQAALKLAKIILDLV